MHPTETIRSLSAPSALEARVPGLSFVPVRHALWRVVAAGGEVRGHVERTGEFGSDRYVARLAVRGARTVLLGEFWSPQAAAECFA